MTETTPTEVVETKTVKKAARKRPAAKTKTVKPTKKTSATKKSKAGKTVPVKPTKKAKPATATKTAKASKAAEESGGVRWTEPRIAIVNALKSLKATKPVSARSAEDIAAKAKVDASVVKHYCYKNQMLVTAGLVGIADVEGITGLAYYLTADGAKAKV